MGRKKSMRPSLFALYVILSPIKNWSFGITEEEHVAFAILLRSRKAHIFIDPDSIM